MDMRFVGHWPRLCNDLRQAQLDKNETGGSIGPARHNSILEVAATAEIAATEVAAVVAEAATAGIAIVARVAVIG